MSKKLPQLVDKSLFTPKPSIKYTPPPLPISFYFNIIIILILILGSTILYYKYITKKHNDDIIQMKLIDLNERINQKLKNID